MQLRGMSTFVAKLNQVLFELLLDQDSVAKNVGRPKVSAVPPMRYFNPKYEASTLIDPSGARMLPSSGATAKNPENINFFEPQAKLSLKNLLIASPTNHSVTIIAFFIVFMSTPYLFYVNIFYTLTEILAGLEEKVNEQTFL